VELAAVPAGFEQALIADATRWRLGRKRYADTLIPDDLFRGVELAGLIEGKLLHTIQGEPTRPAELRARVGVTARRRLFWLRQIGRHCLEAAARQVPEAQRLEYLRQRTVPE